MPRLFSIRYTPLRTCLVNLPMSLYGPLAAKQVRPQRLAVHISLPGVQGVYLGWSGMASASSLSKWQQGAQAAAEALDTVEIDPQVASSYGFQDGATVEIGLVHNLSIATNVETVPLSPDDWEILETHAEYVEQHLLSQVRAVAVGQEISVWVMGRSRIQFRVVSSQPEGQAVLLGPDTEVAIAPKLRVPPKTSNSQTRKNKEDEPAATEVKSKRASSSAGDSLPLALRVLPTRLASAFVSVDASEIEVYISTQDIKKLSHDTETPTHAWLVRVRPPRPVRDFDKRGKPVDVAAPAGVVLQQSKNDEGKVDGGKTHVPGVLARVRVHANVPVGHGVVVGLESKIQDWDTILLTCSDEPVEETSRSSSPSQTAPTEIHTQKPEFSDEGAELAGVDSTLSDCHDFFVRTYMQPDAFGAASGAYLPGLLLHGSTGSGKTSVAKSVVKRLEADPRIHACIVHVDLAQLADEHTSSLRSKFIMWKAVASWRQPSVLVLDNLDKVVSAEVEHTDSARARHLAEHFLDVFVVSPARGVVILASCTSPSAVHPLLTSSHVFGYKVQLRAPDKNARRDILSRIVKRRFATSDLKNDSTRPLNFVALATDTEGYSATDLQDLVGRAVHAAAVRSATDESGDSPVLLPGDFSKAQEDFVPLSLRGVKLQKSDVSWSDIGGLEETRRVLRETLEWPTKYGAIFAKCPLRLRSGLLLYGYPGCGKTLLASAVAKECGLNFISVKGPELLNKYIGQSEQSVRDIFDRASSAKPCVLFLDEFDSIAPKRGHDSTGVTDRVVNQMLTQMDGAEGLDGVYVLAATSRPDLIDPALLRPGRLDKSLLCHMPTEDERVEILKAVSRKVVLATNVDLLEAAKRTEGYSGADLQALVYNAQLEVVHEDLAAATREATVNPTGREERKIKLEIVGGQEGTTSAMTRAETAILEKRVATMLAARAPISSRVSDRRAKSGGDKQRSEITFGHLERSLENHRPSVSPEERWRLQTIYDAFQNDRTGEHKVPPGLSGVGGRATLG